MNDVFLSYAREDRERVEQLAHALGEAGLEVWWDKKIGTGSHFDEVLDQELQASRCLIVVWSQHSIDSDWVRSEANDGFERGILVPVMFEDVSPPLPFRRMQAANLTGWPSSNRSVSEFTRLLDGVQRTLKAEQAEGPKQKASTPYSGLKAKSAVAVLPLNNRSSDPDDEYFADGITEDIITRLQRFKTFPIISRHSVFVYKGKDYDLPNIARELDVAYLVVGHIRKYGNRIRIIVDLVETTDFHTVWSEKYDREIVDIFDLQDEISLIIAAMLEPEIERSERKQALPSRTESIASWHLVRRGLWHQYKLTRQDALEAKRYFELALDQDPDSVEALVQMGWWHWWDLSRRRGQQDDWSEMTRYSKPASVLDPKDSRPFHQIGVATMMGGDPVLALKIFKETIRLNPCNAGAYDSLGAANELIGRPAEALDALDIAIKLSPFDMWIFHAQGERARAYYSMGEWDKAIDAANRSLSLRAGYWLAHMIKSAALARAGRQQEAQQALARLMDCRPEFGIIDIRWIGYLNPAKTDDLIESLRLAGWQPEALEAKQS